MKKLLYGITIFILGLTPNFAHGQEICDDGIDNDGDGLTDCDDPDCTLEGTDIHTECNSNSFTWIDGITYTNSNSTATYTYLIYNSIACDSVVTLNLTFGTNNSGSETVSACNSYTSPSGKVWTVSGTYLDTIPNSINCDSIITINLTINSVSDLTTNSSGNIITANNTNASYQWLDCDNGNAIIPNENGQSFLATVNGSYAVELTENGCIDTSACVAITTIGILENNFEEELLIYPNPSDGSFSIDLGESLNSLTITVSDLSGRLIKSKKYDNVHQLNLSLEEPVGVYLLTLSSEEKNAVFRLIKE